MNKIVVPRSYQDTIVASLGIMGGPAAGGMIGSDVQGLARVFHHFA